MKSLTASPSSFGKKQKDWTSKSWPRQAPAELLPRLKEQPLPQPGSLILRWSCVRLSPVFSRRPQPRYGCSYQAGPFAGGFHETSNDIHAILSRLYGFCCAFRPGPGSERLLCPPSAVSFRLGRGQLHTRLRGARRTRTRSGFSSARFGARSLLDRRATHWRPVESFGRGADILVWRDGDGSQESSWPGLRRTPVLSRLPGCQVLSRWSFQRPACPRDLHVLLAGFQNQPDRQPR